MSREIFSLVKHLEEEGRIPYRSITRGGFGVSLALGGEGIGITVDGRPCEVMIFGATIGIVPLDTDKAEALEEAERIRRSCR